jgi:hypothetical protein
MPALNDATNKVRRDRRERARAIASQRAGARGRLDRARATMRARRRIAMTFPRDERFRNSTRAHDAVTDARARRENRRRRAGARRAGTRNGTRT